MPDYAPPLASRQPAYRRIAHLLRERIERGSYHTDEFLPPERDLAAELNVSRQSVRLAIEQLRQEGFVVPEQGRGTRILAQEALVVAPAGYDQLNLAALVIYGMSRGGSAAIFQGCAAVMQRSNYHLIVAETSIEASQRSRDEAAQLRALLDKGIRGIVIYAEPTDQNRILLQEALAKGVQVVQIDRYLPGLPCDYVGVNNADAAEAMTERLIFQGHRRIAFLTLDPGATSCQERLQGFRNALRTHGLPEDEERIAYCNSQKNSATEIGRIVQRWMRSPEPPTALFAVNDELAFQVLQTLQERGVCVPEQVTVVGFDNLRPAAFVSPPLTTVEQPFVHLGETAAQLLLSRLMGHYTGEPRRVLLPTRLIARNSDGVGANELAPAMAG